MSVDTSWDIESYRTAYESDEHWELKRDFMEAHKDRIPEARLICLAQVFANIELLGCKYPDAVMEQVAVLACDVGHDYKEKKKNKLKRTFVKASDAAGAKVKGTSTSELLGASSPCNESYLSTEQPLSMSPMSSGPTTPMSSLRPGPSTSMDFDHPAPMSSLLGQPPTSLASRLPMMSNPVASRLPAMSNPVAFVKAGATYPAYPLPTQGGSSNATPGSPSMSSNLMSSMLGGGSSSNSSASSSLLGGPSNSMAPRFAGSSNSTSSVFGGSSNSSTSSSLLGGPSNSMASMFGGSSNSASSMFAGSSNSLSLMSSPHGASNTTLITFPPGRKKKSKADKDKDKPITEKFIRFVGGNSNTGAAPVNVNKTANTMPLQRFGGRQGETSGQPSAPTQPGQFSRFSQSPHQQPSQSQQPSTAAATQHNHLSNWCKVVGSNNPLAGFVLVRHENHDNNGAAAAILNTSSCFSRIPINYHYQKVDHLFECTVNINGVDVVTAKATGRKKAREQAVVDAVAELPKHCFTLRIKKSIRAESVTLDQVANDLASRSSFSDNPLATNSVANKMMKQMGWTGGGLGKKGEGITEPIRPSEVFGRQGLGHVETNKGAVTPAFCKRVRDIISEYASNTNKVALAFSNEFSKEQRAEIHKIARLCHLKSASRGKDGKNRCLVISRKIPAQDLLLRLLQEGSNDQYQLTPPSSACLL